LTAWTLGIQDGQALWWHEDFDTAGDAGLAADEARPFEGKDHLVHRGWGDAEVTRHLVFRGRSPMDAGVGVDEGQILALPGGECQTFD